MSEMYKDNIRQKVRNKWKELVEKLYLPSDLPEPWVVVVEDRWRDENERYIAARYIPESDLIVMYGKGREFEESCVHELTHRALHESMNPKLRQEIYEHSSLTIPLDIRIPFWFINDFLAYLVGYLSVPPKPYDTHENKIFEVGRTLAEIGNVSRVCAAIVEYGKKKVDWTSLDVATGYRALHIGTGYHAMCLANFLFYNLRKLGREEEGWKLAREIIEEVNKGTQPKEVSEKVLNKIQTKIEEVYQPRDKKRKVRSLQILLYGST